MFLCRSSKQIWELMRRKRIGAYVGIDPTAPSLHVGHMLPLMALFWLYVHGFSAVTVIGGATAKIGDPTDRLKDRDKLRKTDLAMNTTKIHYQLKALWTNVEVRAKHYDFKKEWSWSRAILNNTTWHNQTSLMEVVSKLFKGIRMGPLLSRESVKKRLEENGEGMPLDEFLYPLLQAWDWWKLFNMKGVLMQIGGSDQYGNILTGVESINYIRDTEPNLELRLPNSLENTPVGFTVPLLTDSSGAKFGKSAGNAVWLDPFMTSSFDLYGYFVRRPDADVEQLLKLLTFMPLELINKTMEEQNKDPSKRVAQHALAFEMVALAHSAKHAQDARDQHAAIYSKKKDTAIAAGLSTAQNELKQFPTGPVPADQNQAIDFKPNITLPASLIHGTSMGRILHAAGLAASISDGVRLSRMQGAYVAGAPGQKSATNKGMKWGDLTFTPVKNWFPEDTKNFLIDGKILIIRRGKHFYRMIDVVSDEVWKQSGQTYPGEPGTGRSRQISETVKSMRAAGVEVGRRTMDRIKTNLMHDKLREEAKQKGQLYIPSGKPPNKPVSKDKTTR
jgi:tyrosyl-tRNA synthetase